MLPSPQQFFILKGLWPDTGDERILDFCQLFLHIALEKWLSRLSQEAAKEVPPAVMAVKAIDAINQSTPSTAPVANAKREDPSASFVSQLGQVQLQLHPLALLQLPGGEPTARAILQAKYKAQQMEVEAEIMRICCGPGEQSGTSRSSLLDEAGMELKGVEGLQKERLNMCIQRLVNIMRCLASHLSRKLKLDRSTAFCAMKLPVARPETDKQLEWLQAVKPEEIRSA